MAYRTIDLVATLRRRHLLRRAAMVAAAALVAGLVIGGSLRAARADDAQGDNACPKGRYSQFWSGDVPALTKSNTKLAPDQAKQFIKRLNESSAMGGNYLPVEGTTIRLLVHKDTNKRFGLAIDTSDCVIAYGFIDDDFLAYLMGKGPMPERYEPPGEQI